MQRVFTAALSLMQKGGKKKNLGPSKEDWLNKGYALNDTRHKAVERREDLKVLI